MPCSLRRACGCTRPSSSSHWRGTCSPPSPSSPSCGERPAHLCLPHWPAPGYLLLFPLLGDALAQSERPRLVRRALVAAAVALVFLLAIAASDVATGWVTRAAPSLFRRGDPSLEALDWRDLAPELIRRGLLGGPGREPMVFATSWIDAAKIGYALGPSRPIFCLGDDPRGFLYVFRPTDLLDRDALLLVRVDGRTRPADIQARYGQYFRSLAPADSVPIRRAGRVEFLVAAFRAQLFRGSIAAASTRDTF